MGKHATSFECSHPAASEIEVSDGGASSGSGEIVCGACGVVKFDGGRSLLQGRPADGSGTATQAAAAQSTPVPAQLQGQGSRPNLYLEMEIGGKPDRTLRGDKYVHRQTDLAVVSNIAQKLGVPNHVGQAVWAWYRRLHKELGMTKSKCLVMAFHGVCRSMGCPLVESKLLECIRMELGVRNAHPYLRVVMEASSYMCPVDGGGRAKGTEMILRRCGFLDLVGDQGDVMRFALGCEVQSLADQYEAEIVSRIAGSARSLLSMLSKREKNPRRAARMAVRMACVKVCGQSGVSR
ncbi:MAG: hypothetical protein OXI27_08745 [Thaumarchaeota archaeon]|nr:hypothetical protein [Nitrososphaerota archaeon]MDE0526662.1 hypothetical protein [Nitrososphaerota archaeon]